MRFQITRILVASTFHDYFFLTVSHLVISSSGLFSSSELVGFAMEKDM
jgi:hypothetical protein